MVKKLVVSEASFTAVVVLVCSTLLTWIMRELAVSGGVLDVPNERSSHSVPRPRGGGVAIALAASGGLVFLACREAIALNLLWGLVGGGIAVGTVGFLDDRNQLSARIRIIVHLTTAIWAVGCIGGVPPMRIDDQMVSFGWISYPLAALTIVWALNLFNFMDGIDGIAASEAVFVCGAGAALCVVGMASCAVPAAALVVAAASLGFLVWNWPPAKIFMGDVGSGYLGYVIAILALSAARENNIALFQWLILGGVFFVDATVTLLRRLMRGEKVYLAHRSHAYQRLARRWNSHLRVTASVLLINLLWLLPCAWLAGEFAHYAWLIMIGALMPLVGVALLAGAGGAQD